MFIGIYGEIGAGKDTVAEILVNNYFFSKLSFGDAVKQVAHKFYGVPLDNFYDRFKKEEHNTYWNKTHREMLQYIGTNIVRNTGDKDHWIKRLHLVVSRRFLFEPGREENYVIPDVRFQNEVDYILSQDGFIIHIEREINPLRPKSEAGKPKHESELYNFQIPPNQHWNLHNSGDKHALVKNVTFLYEKMKESHATLMKLKLKTPKETL